MKENKKGQIKKDVKTLDKATYVTRQAKNAYISTKEKSEQHGYDDDGNYINYASNITGDSIKAVTGKGQYIAKRYTRKTIEKIKGRKRLDNDSSWSNANNTDDGYSARQNREKGISKRNATSEAIKQPFKQSSYSSKVNRTSKQIKTQPLLKPENQETIKNLSQTRVKTARKPIKTTKLTAKTAIKTKQEAVKATSKAIQAKQRTMQAGRRTRQNTTISSKMVKRAIKAVTKKIALAVNSTTPLIIAGGSISFVIILVVCLAGFLLSSAFGVFFSNKSLGANTPTMAGVIRKLNEELYMEIKQIKTDNIHDTLELHSKNENDLIIRNWKEILPIYAVKTASNSEESMDVATLDDIRIGILRSIFCDMNQIGYWIETIENEETVTIEDGDGNKVEDTIILTETILHIDLISKTYLDMITEYNFNSEQIDLLNELMQDEYQELFIQLIEG